MNDIEKRVLAAAFGGVFVGELIPHLQDVANDGRIRTRYFARCPACGESTFTFSQGSSGIVCGCEAGCSGVSIAEVIVHRRLEAGESPEDIWTRASRFLSGA